MITELDEFTEAYIICALWSSTDDVGVPLDKNHTIDDISDAALSLIIEDCKKFQAENATDIVTNPKQAGHDFWLTRCHHGAGYWDGDWSPEVGERLTKASHAFGEKNLIIGDDGKIHYE